MRNDSDTLFQEITTTEKGTDTGTRSSISRGTNTVIGDNLQRTEKGVQTSLPLTTTTTTTSSGMDLPMEVTQNVPGKEYESILESTVLEALRQLQRGREFIIGGITIDLSRW